MVSVTGVLWLRMRAAWRRRWAPLLATALLVTVALGVTLTAVAGARRTHSAPARFFREDGTADVTVSMSKVDSLEGAKEIAALPQVRDVSVNAAMAAFPFSTSGDFMPVLAPVDGTGGVKIFRGVLQAGRRPDPRAVDEIMLSESHARTLDAHVGDRIPFVAFDDAQAQQCLYENQRPPVCAKLFRTPRFSVRVVGIFRTGGDVNSRSRDITLSVHGGGFFARHRTEIAWNAIIWVRLRPGVPAESFVAAARRALPPGIDAEFDLVNASATVDAVGVLATGLWLFALVAGLAGAFAVGQAVVRQVRSDDEERAALAMLGATRRTVFADALGPALLAAALGIAAAVVAAYVASAWMPIGFARRVDPSRGRELDWLVMVAGAAICLVTVAVAAVGAVSSSRRRVGARASTHAIPAFLAANAASPAAAVGLRHACSPGRGRGAVPVRSALGGVAAATAGVVAVLGFSAGLAHLIDTPALYGWTYDVTGVDPAHSARVVADPAVAAVADVHSSVILRVNDRPAFGLVIDPIAGEIAPAIVAGRAPVARDEIALGADTLHATRTRIGSAVAIAGPAGKLAMRVVGQAVFPTVADAYPLADGAVVTPGALRILGDANSSHSLAIRYRPGVDRAAAFARLDALERSDPSADPPERAAPPSEIEKLRQVESLPKVLAGFLALLGVIALGHALVVGARRRARDFAVLRALGFRRREVRAAVAWEAGAVAFAGALIGIPVGIVVGRIAWARTARGIGVLVVHRAPTAVVLAVLPAAVMLAIVIAWLPARRAAKLRPAAILRSE